MTIQIDDSRHPIVVVRFLGVATNAELEDYLTRMELLLLRREVNCAILDATRAGKTPALQRQMQADWLRRNEKLLRRYSAGTAFVIDSPVVRGLLTAILWMSPLATPHIVVSSFDDAERWARRQLDARYVDVDRSGTEAVGGGGISADGGDGVPRYSAPRFYAYAKCWAMYPKLGRRFG